MFLNKPNHCISLRRNMWCSNNPRGTQLDVVALWRSRADYIIQTQKSTVCPRTNIMKYRLRGGIPCSSLYHIQLNRHRLHRLARDNFDEFPFPNLQYHTIFQHNMLFIAFFTINFEGSSFDGSSCFPITCC